MTEKILMAMKFTEAQLEQAIISPLGEQGYPYAVGSSIIRTEEKCLFQKICGISSK